MTHVFLCSKPFQLVSLLNLPYNFTEASVKKILVILNHFPDAQSLAEKVKIVCPFFTEVFVVDKREQVAAILLRKRASVLYSELDTGKIAYTWSLIVKEMNVYEEGTQTYRNIREHFQKNTAFAALKQYATRLLGWGAYLGTNRKTRYVYVYNPDYFKEHLSFLRPKVRGLNKPLYQFLADNLQLFTHFFPISVEINALKNEKVAVYVTSHELNDEVVQKLKADQHLYDQIFIKVHPHLYHQQPEVINAINELPFTVVVGNLLAEMMFITLLENENTLSVFHESSTACLYLQESDRVEIYDYRKGAYREFYKELRDCYSNSSLAME